MKHHHFPEHVVGAVAKALWDTAPASAVLDWEDIQPEDTRNRRSDYLEKAHAALSALWEASRVDTVEQLEAIPDFSSLVDADGFTYKAYELRNPNVFPVHVIHWSNEL